MVDALTLNAIAQSMGLPIWALFVALIWSLFWKAIAMWKSARLNQPIWFALLLLINTVGILEILYIFLFSEIKIGKKTIKVNRKKRN
jgi:methionyl-tRNA synthetase